MKLRSLTLLFFLYNTSIFWGQEAVTLSGSIVSGFEKEAVPFASVAAIEPRLKATSDEAGNFSLALPGPGEYTIQISAPGLKPFRQKISITQNLTRQFVLEVPSVRSDDLTITGERDIQKISRNTLGRREIKETPATFGDALNALTTLPSVIRPAGIFGPLIIRAAGNTANRYFIDDIPVINPQHFGALQSVISNDIIDKIDLYSSAFPAQFGQATGAVIDIQTIDDVKEFGGVLDISLISANFLLKDAWQTLKKEDSSKNGYWVAAARASYLQVFIPPIIELVSDEEVLELPQYYDYQLKGKYFLDDKGEHAFKLFLFGSYDTLLFLQEEISDEDRQNNRSEGVDPRLDQFKIENEIFSNSQGLYYTYEPSFKFRNDLILFNSLNFSRFVAKSFVDSSLDLSIDARPNIAGIKDKMRLRYLDDIGRLQLSTEYNLYYFDSDGQNLTLNEPIFFNQGPPEPGSFTPRAIDFNTRNHTVALAADNTLKFGGLQITPGVRVDYLHLTNKATTAPRGVVSYEFPSQTTISAAGGLYYSFPQTNWFLFNQPFGQVPEVATDGTLKPEEGLHRVLGIEQKFLDLYSIKTEVFYNTYRDLLIETANQSTSSSGLVNSAESRVLGVEVLLQKSRFENVDSTLYYWLSYTYTRAEFRFNRDFANSNVDGSKWYKSEYDQTHSLKLVLGYLFGQNSLSMRFELYSGFPYTPITGNQAADNSYTPSRYQPVSGEPFAARFPVNHRLDIRYSRKTKLSWALFTWYIEISNVYNFKARNNLRWNYSEPYNAASNPKLEEAGLPILPYFGLEFRF